MIHRADSLLTRTKEKKITDFDTRNTRKFFVALGVTEEFLQENPFTRDTNNVIHSDTDKGMPI